MTRRIVPLILIAFSLLIAGSVAWAAPASTPAPLDPAEPSQPGAVQALSVTLSASKDIYVNSAMPNTNYGSATNVWVGRTSSGTISQTLIYFNVSSVPGGAKVLSATLRLCDMINLMTAQDVAQGAAPNAPQAATDLWAEAITGIWSETGVTWNNKPGSTYLGDPPATHGFDYTTFNVTNIVQRWVSGTLTNNGILLRPDAAMTTKYWFYSRTDAGCPPQLKIFYSEPVTGVVISGPVSGLTGSTYNFTATVSPGHATTPITYTWSPAPKSGQGTRYAAYDWGGRYAIGGLKTITVTAQNESGSAVDTHTFNLITPLTSASISGPTSGLTDTTYTFTTSPRPIGFSLPITYTWSPTPNSGQGTSSATYQWNTAGVKTITLTAQNPGSTVTDTHVITISNTIVPVSSVSISGPATGTAGSDYDFTANVSPVTATAPVYTWMPAPLDGQGAAIATYNWNTPGVKTITVTAQNSGGIATDTHTINVTALPVTGVSLSGKLNGLIDVGQTFVASSSPATATTPLTYTWQATEQSQLIQSGNLTSTAIFTWTSSGTKYITVTAANGSGSATAYFSTTLYQNSTLYPDLTMVNLWNESSVIWYRLGNYGASTAPAGYEVTLYIDGDRQEQVVVTRTLTSGSSRDYTFATPWLCGTSTCAIKICVDEEDLVWEKSESNNCREQTWQGDLTYPNFSTGPTASSITTNSAVISWATDKAASGKLEYGTKSNVYDQSQNNAALKTTQRFTLTNLTPGTVYNYKATATDAVGHVANKAGTFETQYLPGTHPTILTLAVTPESGPYEVLKVEARLSEVTSGVVDHVEFFWNGTFIGADYEPFLPTGSVWPRYSVHLSPVALGLTRAQFFGVAHTAMAKVIYFSGSPTSSSTSYTPPTSPMSVTVNIQSPVPDYEISIPGSQAPAGTVVNVVVNAAEYDWKCTWGGSSPFPDVPAVNCGDVDQGAQMVKFYYGSTLLYTSTRPSPNVYTHTFQWNLSGYVAGPHTIKAEAIASDGTKRSAQTTVKLTQSPPSLDVTREVHRTGHRFTVKLTIRNYGAGEARLVELRDNVTRFQPYNDAPGSYAVNVSYSNSIGSSYRRNSVSIDFNPPGLAAANSPQAVNGGVVPPGGSFVVEYQMVPILYEDGDATDYAIGAAQIVLYHTVNGQTVEQGFSRYQSVVYNSSGDLEPLSMAVINAVGSANYLVVTNPPRLFNYYEHTDVKRVLSEMAHLAYLKQGIVAYLDSYCENTFLNLLKPGGLWADSLDPDFVSPLNGYMLIVGEAEIVPAWHGTGFDRHWNGGGTTDDVYLSDKPYSHIKGDGAPDLVVSRIIGNDAAALLKPIRASVRQAEGQSNYNFDRSQATLISGTGNGQGDFVGNVNSIASLIQPQTSVTKIHWKDYYVARSFNRAFSAHNGFAAGNVDGTGKAEILIADQNDNHVYILDANGAVVGGFARTFDAGDGLAAGDVNDDNKDEIVIGDYSDGKIYVYNKDGGVISSFSANFGDYDGLAVGDTNGDDKDEIVMADRADHIYVFDQAGVTLSDFDFAFARFDGLAVASVIDWHKHQEIVLASIGDDHIYLLDMNGTTLGGFDRDFEEGDGLAAGDVTGNGKKEILVGDRNDHVYYYDATGSQLAELWVDFSQYDGFAAGDVQDGDTSVISAYMAEPLVANQSGQIKILDMASGQRMYTALKTQTSERDVLYFMGHGNTNVWGGGLNAYKPKLEFNNTVPVALAPSCLTGGYGGPADYSMGEYMFDSGAAVYIGSTEVSPIGYNAVFGKKFFEKWGATDSAARAWTEVERSTWGDPDDYDWYKFMTWEYNVYGDAKFGTTAGLAQQSAAVPASAQGLATATIHVPDYTVTDMDGTHYVDIPGGDSLFEPGQPRVPYYAVTYDYPAGQRVTGVTLTNRAGLVLTTGLNIPTATIEIACPVCSPGAPSAPRTPAQAVTWFPDLGKQYTWSVVENGDGSTQLVITLFPFYYDAESTDVRFYQDYVFDIETIATSVRLHALTTDKAIYAPGEPVSIDLLVGNTGAAQDVIVNTAVKLAGLDKQVDGLPLHSLHALSGTASFNMTWNSGGFASGQYMLEAQLTDNAGNVLGVEARAFRVGTTSGQVTSLAATPTAFDAGQPVTISMVFGNTGNAAITGTAYIQVQISPTLTTTVMFSHTVANLAPGAFVTLSDVWDTTGVTPGAYRILGYVAYEGQTSDPQAVMVNTRYRIYLPIVIR